MAGAFAGTMLGAMLFRSLGIGAGGAGGSGLMLLLLIGLGFGAYFLFRKRYGIKPQQEPLVETNVFEETMGEIDELNMVDDHDFKTQRSRDFFSIQHAWSKKDLSNVNHLMTPIVEEEFNKEITEMNDKGHTSTLENLMVENTQIVSSWNELEVLCATVKFDVSLIEYESDTNGNVVNGSKTDYTRMTEYWTFSKSPNDDNWKVCAVENP
jgi:hypothetical protein